MEASLNTLIFSNDTKIQLKNVVSINVFNNGMSQAKINGFTIMPNKKLNLYNGSKLDEITLKIEFSSTTPADNNLELASIILLKNETYINCK